MTLLEAGPYSAHKAYPFSPIPDTFKMQALYYTYWERQMHHTHCICTDTTAYTTYTYSSQASSYLMRMAMSTQVHSHHSVPWRRKCINHENTPSPPPARQRCRREVRRVCTQEGVGALFPALGSEEPLAGTQPSNLES